MVLGESELSKQIYATSFDDCEDRKTNIPLGVWYEEVKLCFVREPKGKHVSRMGFFSSGVKWLMPEEAAFLVAEGEMELATIDEKFSTKLVLLDSPIAFELVYRGLAFHKVELADYYVYVALKKLRFNVFRSINWNGTDLVPESIPSGECDPEEKLILRFNSYTPNSKFCLRDKSTTPQFQVAVSRPYDQVPSVTKMNQLGKQCGEMGTKLRIGMFDGSSVSFVQVEPFRLQNAADLANHLDNKALVT